jgi:tetratricopeptide (TPR) repeat protein
MITPREFIGRVALLTCGWFAVNAPCYAQHPIEVQRLSAEANHVRAMAAFSELPERKVTTAATVAMGNSAWALGLNSRAAQAFDRALRDPALGSEMRARLLFSRGLIEFQNSNFQIASLFAERSFAELPAPSPLRAQVLALWGESLVKQENLGPACTKLTQASEEAGESQLPDIFFSLGGCQKKMGALDEARASYEHIPLEHDKASSAVRALATLALELKRYPQAEFWLMKGRELFPERFLDGWVDYAHMTILTEQGRGDEVRTLLAQATERYPQSDGWFQLLRSRAELFLWKASRAPASPSESEVASTGEAL